MRSNMRTYLAVMLSSFAVAASFASAQSASSYAWCARYYKEGGGTPRCYFDTRDQCLASISGVGGFCVENYNTAPGGQTRADSSSGQAQSHRLRKASRRAAAPR